MNGRPEVSVVIPNWNGEKFVGKCLESLKNQTFKDFETVFVDNHSADASVARARETLPQARIIPLSDNFGFAGGVNQGIRAAQGEMIALLNNDTEADPRWLEELCSTLKANPGFGFATSKIILMKDKKTIDSCGDGYSWYGIPYPLGRDQIDRGQFDSNGKVFSACGGAAIYKKEVFEKVGLFDEDFFAYYEDTDLSFRAQLAGYRCLFVPRAVVYHEGGKTSGRDKPRFAYYHPYKNRALLVIKNIPAGLFLKNIHKFAAGMLYTLFHSIGNMQFFTLLRAWSRVAGLLVKKLGERKAIQGRRTVSDEYLEQAILPQFPPVSRHFKFLQG